MPCQPFDVGQVCLRLGDLLDRAAVISLVHRGVVSGSETGGGRGEGVENIRGEDDPVFRVRWVPELDHRRVDVAASADPVAGFDVAIGYRVASVGEAASFRGHRSGRVGVCCSVFLTPCT